MNDEYAGSDQDFAVGEIVRLQTGGPLMTVNGFDDHDRIVCVWFDESILREAKFWPAALEKVE